jgi:hypothetical protein
MLVTLINEAPRTEPILRVYGNYMSFNMHASKLLGLEEGDKVFIGRDDRSGNYLYVGKARMKQSYAVTKRGNTFDLYSAKLAREVAGLLEGTGAYRICPEDKIEDGFGNIFYNIFRKKYGN